jgi:hypothetical protein
MNWRYTGVQRRMSLSGPSGGGFYARYRQLDDRQVAERGLCVVGDAHGGRPAGRIRAPACTLAVRRGGLRSLSAARDRTFQACSRLRQYRASPYQQRSIAAPRT